MKTALKIKGKAWDAYEAAELLGKTFNSVIFDVWKGYGEARHDRRWLEIARQAKAHGAACWCWD